MIEITRDDNYTHVSVWVPATKNERVALQQAYLEIKRRLVNLENSPHLHRSSDSDRISER